MSQGRKKPIGKKRAHLIDQLKRKSGVRELKKRFLIVCEDDKSAPNYFKALKKHENLSATSIEVVGSGGNTQPIQVVDEAIRRKVAAADGKSATEPFDEVWCLIDGDYGSKIANARFKAESNDIKLAVSNKCFEYWVLLHFAHFDSPTQDCSGLVRVLRDKHLPEYDKGKFDFSKIVVHAREAAQKARRLRRTGELPEDQNPSSDVYQLIGAILSSAPEPGIT